MTDPTVSNVRDGPREGLPPCIIRAARLDNRVAWLAEAGHCPCEGWSGWQVGYGLRAPAIGRQPCKDWYIHPVVTPRLEFDDPDEAQAAFERGAEYVRTGVLE